MSIIYLITIILGCAFQNVSKKTYSQRTAGKGAFTFALIAGGATTLFFLLTSHGLDWNTKLIPYAIFFALSYSFNRQPVPF